MVDVLPVTYRLPSEFICNSFRHLFPCRKPDDIGYSESFFHGSCRSESDRRDYEIHGSVGGFKKIVEIISHCPCTSHLEAFSLQQFSQFFHAPVHGKIKRRHSQNIHLCRTCICIGPSLRHHADKSLQSLAGSAYVGFHAVCLKSECRNSALSLDRFRDRPEIRPDDMGKGTAADRNKARVELVRRRDKIRNQLVIIPENRVLFSQTGYEDQAVHVVPARFVVRVVGGVAAGCVVHDHQTAELVEG